MANGKPRVLFLYDFPIHGGGSGAYVKFLALRLIQAYKYDLAVALPDRQQIDPKIPQYSINLPQVPVFIGRPGLEKSKKYSDLTPMEIGDLYCTFIAETVKVVQDFKPDLINVHHVLIGAWVARYIRSIFGTKFILSSHGSCIHAISQDRRYFRLTRDSMWAANSVTVVSGDTRVKLLKMFGDTLDSKLRTIPGGVRFSFFPERKPQNLLKELVHKYGIDSTRVVLFTGRLISEKGVEYLIKAASKIRGQVVIIGDGPQKEKLVHLVEERKLPNVKMLGYIDHKYLLDMYYLASVFVSPSVWDDPMPLTIIEAMAAGLPVVVTRRGGFPIAVKDGLNGYFVKSRNATDIAEKVNKLLDNKDLRLRMGERARVVVSEKFTWTKIAARFDKLFRDVYLNR